MATKSAIGDNYKDLDLKFKSHPLYGDIRPLKDVNAVKNSVRNILLTNPGDRPFSRIGANLKPYLFEPVDDITAISIQNEIEYSIKEYEPRVEVIGVTVTPKEDANRYDINVEFKLVNGQEAQDLNITIKRLR